MDKVRSDAMYGADEGGQQRFNRVWCRAHDVPSLPFHPFSASRKSLGDVGDAVRFETQIADVDSSKGERTDKPQVVGCVVP
jgi:hypothetical protein